MSRRLSIERRQERRDGCGRPRSTSAPPVLLEQMPFDATRRSRALIGKRFAEPPQCAPRLTATAVTLQRAKARRVDCRHRRQHHGIRSIDDASMRLCVLHPPQAWLS